MLDKLRDLIGFHFIFVTNDANSFKKKGFNHPISLVCFPQYQNS
jgi:hypothetical protein